MSISLRSLLFFFNDTATTEIYTLSLHDALPISIAHFLGAPGVQRREAQHENIRVGFLNRSEEHTSELQSHSDLVCRLLLEKKKKQKSTSTSTWWSTPTAKTDQWAPDADMRPSST